MSISRFTSTAGNVDSEPVSSTEEMRAQMVRFSESLYDKDIDTAKEIIKKNSLSRTVLGTNKILVSMD